MLIALFLHLTIVLILRRYDLRAAEGRSSTDVRAGRRVNLVAPGRLVRLPCRHRLSGLCHDYYFYLQMWYEVREGHDPWFHRPRDRTGCVPLNAYGPLFNLLAGLSWVNPLAPKLLFAYAYVLFAVSQIKCFTASRPPSGLPMIVLTALFWNPFPWVEIAFRGISISWSGCLACGRSERGSAGHDALSGICLALGVLLKYLPVVLLPFLALDRGRLRPRFLVVAVASIALGLGLSCYLWGPSTLLPLKFAATRSSTVLSIFCFIRGRYSPLHWFGVADELRLPGAVHPGPGPAACVVLVPRPAAGHRGCRRGRGHDDGAALSHGFSAVSDGALRARLVLGRPALGGTSGAEPPGSSRSRVTSDGSPPSICIMASSTMR